MKKTLNINIGNSIIHIEEDACELLTNYLIEVKQHFGKSADDFEIVSDIENRIAEMFTEILHNQQKQIIEMEDVQIVIASMGSVKDFEEQSEEEPATGRADAHAAFNERRVYRDTDEAMIAGVCSGLSHYLRLDVSVLRIVAVLTILLGGSGFIAYLILWVSIPKAATRGEKMAMKGETANLQGFKRNFEVELLNLRDNLKDANDHFRPLIKHSKSFIAEFVEVLGRFFQGTGKTIFKLIALLIVIAGSLMLLSAIIAMAAIIGFWDTGSYQFFPFSIIDQSYFTAFVVSVFIVIAIPLIALILLSIRVAFNSPKVNKMVNYSLLLIWLGGLAIGIFYVAKTTTQFKETAEFTQSVPLKPYPAYTLAINRSRFFSKEDSLHYRLNTADYNGRIIQNDLDGPFTLPRNVTIRIEKSDNNIPSLVESYSSQGFNFEVALDHAKNIQYDFTQKDSVLVFSPELHLKKNQNWRDQHIELVFKVPIGTKLKIDRDLQRYVRDHSLWECENENENMYKGIMTADGLDCQSEK